MKHQVLSTWLKRVVGLVAAWLWLVSVAAAQPTFTPIILDDPPQPLFTDNFNDGNDDGWTQINRSWHLTDGRYYIDGCYGCDGVPLAGHRDGFSYTHVDDPTWTDYTFEFTFDTTNAPSPYNPDWAGTAFAHNAMALFRVQGSLPGPQGAPTQYLVHFCVPCELASGEHVVLAKYVNGNPTPTILADEPTSGVILLGTNIGKIIALGGHIKIFVNNQLVLDITDPDPITFGGIGLGAVWEVNAWFDNVSVTPEFFSVIIDIQPGSDPNVINLRHTQIIRVALLSTSNFDTPTEVDRRSLTFGRTGDEDSLLRKDGVPNCRTQDVNEDGLPDLVCAFSTQKAGFVCGDAIGILKGEILDGEAITAQDAVVIESCSL